MEIGLQAYRCGVSMANNLLNESFINQSKDGYVIVSFLKYGGITPFIKILYENGY